MLTAQTVLPAKLIRSALEYFVAYLTSQKGHYVATYLCVRDTYLEAKKRKQIKATFYPR